MTKLIGGTALARADARQLMARIMAGELTTAQIAAVAVALRMRGESADELLGFAQAMRQQAVPVPAPPAETVDTCGTGGDRLDTFNISTAAALVAAGAGVLVAKHGNRAASSRSGSADVLEALGVRLDLAPAQAARALQQIGIAFLFARAYHPALKHAAAARAELGVRTIFNLLGPLTNPAGARRQLLGVFPGADATMVATVLRELGTQRALVVRGHDGMDELTLTAPSDVTELRDGVITSYQLAPADVGLSPCTLDDLRGGDAAANAAIIREILAGAEGPKTDIVLFNAGACIYLADRADSIAQGIHAARAAIASGAARAKLAQLVAFGQAQ
ncbi:MAG: anthranilate phosphoribosyltransferase [bacterium]|nr:anthranilate phosphoribosyltransferase [bacterium]